MQAQAFAKLNLTLDILGKREDGYHDLQMVMQSIALADTLTITPGEGRMDTSLSYLPSDDRNLAQLAAAAFRAATGLEVRVDITIDKRIPVCAGLAGGSSDAAAVLRALNECTNAGLTPEQLAKIGEQVGSDVPYCVMGGTALAEGRGERLTPLPPLPACHVVVCKPPFPISTPQLFARVDMKKIVRRPDTAGMIAALEAADLAGAARRMYNVFEDVLEPRRRVQIDEIKARLIDCGALGACMTGSGPTVFGLFDGEAAARLAAQRLGEQYREVFLTQTV
ncbi:MAG TPA: 4-(cytidine 5'-diphospho)-2-C-methyl-D-erythritol kinase [Candidatus Enterenecus stercoripullorum]|nr:4-(cytidine 5'-diphospho)-2-C-methyl-D-erythritol kinase [Candidatus Enterenecus stercoripullorum]